MLVLAFLALGVASGEESARMPSPRPAAPIVVEGNRRVCRSVQSTGSILSKKTCKTKWQWDEERAASLRFMDRKGRELTTYQQMQIYIENQKKNQGQ